MWVRDFRFHWNSDELPDALQTRRRDLIRAPAKSVFVVIEYPARLDREPVDHLIDSSS